MKKLLFIPIGFYDYDDMIEKELISAGYDVTRFTPIGDFNKHKLGRAINVLSKDRYVYRLAHDRSEKYLLKDDTRYDVVFVIVGRHLLPDIMKRLREKHRDSYFVLYLWDDVKRVKFYNKNKEYYDKIFTFDYEDSVKYNLEFLPLFFTDKHIYNGENKKYELSMVGTYHSDRLRVWESLSENIDSSSDRMYLYLVATQIKQVFKAYFPSKDKWNNPKYIKIKLQSFESMAEKLKETKNTVDVQFGSQRGLTLRTLESLAAHTKLITTNENVKKYDFYEYGNIQVISRDNPVVSKEFLMKDYNEVPEEIVEKYSLKNWIKTILNKGI